MVDDSRPKCKRCAGRGYVVVGTMEDQFVCPRCRGTGEER